MPNADREQKKEYIKKYLYDVKSLLNHLISCAEELKNVFLHKYIFKYHQS